MTEGHAQELKTQALALGVGKRLRVILSDNNAGIDDVLLGGVIPKRNTGYNIAEQWSSYGWNVIRVADGGDYGQVVAAIAARWRIGIPTDRRPMIAIAKTTKGYWPAASNGNLTDKVKQIVSYQSHPYAYKMNSDYFVALASTFEERYGVTFEGISNGAVTDERERLIQFKTNIDVVMSVLDKNGLGDWVAEPAGGHRRHHQGRQAVRLRRQARSVPG